MYEVRRYSIESWGLNQFVVYLTTLSVAHTQRRILVNNELEYEIRRQWPNLSFRLGIFMEGLKKKQISVGIVGLQTSIWTRNLPHTK